MTANLIERGPHPTPDRPHPRPVSSRTALHARAVLRRALGKALKEGLVTHNVAALADARSTPKEAAYLTPDQMKTLLDAVADEPLGPLVTVAATTGMRQGETLGLCWSDVDLDNARLTVRRQLAPRTRKANGAWAYALTETKTHLVRSVPLPARAVEALRRQRVRQNEARLRAGPLSASRTASYSPTLWADRSTGRT